MPHPQKNSNHMAALQSNIGDRSISLRGYRKGDRKGYIGLGLGRIIISPMMQRKTLIAHGVVHTRNQDHGKI